MSDDTALVQGYLDRYLPIPPGVYIITDTVTIPKQYAERVTIGEAMHAHAAVVRTPWLCKCGARHNIEHVATKVAEALARQS